MPACDLRSGVLLGDVTPRTVPLLNIRVETGIHEGLGIVLSPRTQFHIPCELEHGLFDLAHPACRHYGRCRRDHRCIMPPGQCHSAALPERGYSAAGRRIGACPPTQNPAPPSVQAPASPLSGGGPQRGWGGAAPRVPGRPGAGHSHTRASGGRAEVPGVLERPPRKSDVASSCDRSRSSRQGCDQSDYLRPTPFSPMWKILWLSRVMSTTSLVVVSRLQVRVTTASV